MTTPDDEFDTFREFRSTKSRRIRNQLVEAHMGLAAHIARRFALGRTDEDLRQVAMIGLVKSVERFDPERGVAFATFAGRTIEGELKRHFRDGTWSVRVPRRAKELHLAVRKATDEVGQKLGRAPTVDEIAAHLDIDRDDVIAGLAASAAQRSGSLDSRDDDDAMDRNAALATDDHRFELAEHREVVAELLARLPDRERRIVELRFFEGCSQSDIADTVGISQMHVSRLLRRSFEQMRVWLDDEPS
jgi:RNA polymerase sigma-B factor